MKRIVMATVCALFLPASLSAMKDEHSIGVLLTADEVEKLQVLEQRPEPGSMVVIEYEDGYQWALVRKSLGKNNFSVIPKRQDGAALGIVLPLENLYTLVQNEKK